MLQRLKNSRLAVFSIRISGVITSKTLSQVSRDLTRMSLYRPAALAVIVNSPGGSATSSHLIAQRLRSYAETQQVPLYGFAEGVAASGGYMVLSQCREIYVNPGSLLGSIGVRFDFLSYKQLAQKYGIERRVWSTSPLDPQVRIDPLGDLSPETKKWLSTLLEDTHKDFITDVQVARGSRLSAAKSTDPLLNGEVFIGQKAIEMGCDVYRLADKIGDSEEVLKTMFPKLKVVDLSRRKSWEGLKTWVQGVL